MSGDSRMRVKDLEIISGIPLLYQVGNYEGNATDWAAKYAESVDQLLTENGALLVRGLSVSGSKQLARVLELLFGSELAAYQYRSTPRTQMRSNVYTATEYHKDETIPQHNENSYSDQKIMRIGFYCQQPSLSGGETPIADSRVIYKEIPADIRDKFAAKKILYVRNYQELDLPWSEVFQTQDREVVEEYCRTHRIEFEWLANDGLRTKQINQAIAEHPITKEIVWYNQAHLFHISNLQKHVRDSMLDVLGEENLPRNTYFGDGSPIDEAELDVIRNVYVKNQIMFQWQKHDLLLLDNMLFSHGRQPYSGERMILTGMTGSPQINQL